MRHYELLSVLKPTLTEEETLAKINFIKEVLEKNGAQIAAIQDMKTRRLAYPIEKNDRGYYCVFYFTAPTTAILEVERLIRITEEFIRFMTVKYENQKELKHWNKQVEKFTPKVVKEVIPEVPAVAEVAIEETLEQEPPKEITTQDLMSDEVVSVKEISKTTQN